ncbi:MAG: type 4a pilus biogenesis protein PilO [Candidatus Eisenbacteria bacterium]|uniref:Type 4a pilus biogenesis protein PilO n=1 Tax=Eiseniibacteriota bacterium TaxID=2212470 RepID=A0A937XAD2_UNCEI|nr:type 4a pilus biogenesis protein PilO [Candidatus Eisenbacteria bacterium]
MTDPRRVDGLGRAALFALVAAFGLLAARELVRPVLNARRELADLREAVAILTSVEGDVDRLNAEIRLVTRQVDAIETLLPAEPGLDDFLQHLGILAQRHRVRVENLTPGQVAARPQFREQEIGLRATGPFLALYRFLRDLERGPQLASVRRLDIVRTPESGACALELRLALYFAPAGGTPS